MSDDVDPGAHLRSCSSCVATHGAVSYRRTVLVILTSPRGPYALCLRCLGRDGEPRGRTPAAIPPPRATQPRRRSLLR